MSEARINRISNEKGDGGPSLSGITTFSGLNYFVPPKGTTAERPSDCPPGSIRFNTDSAHLEYWDGLQWLEFEATNDELGISNNAAGTSGGLGTRGVLAGENTPAVVTDMDYFTISTLGNAIDFGNLSSARGYATGCSSRTNGLIMGGFTPGSSLNIIDRFQFSSTSSSLDFADLSVARNKLGSVSNSTRGLGVGGDTPETDTIDYIAIDGPSGVTAQDFGNIGGGGAFGCAGVSNSTRGVFAVCARTPTNVETNAIEYLTISTTGDSQDFGDLVYTSNGALSASNSTRGIFAGSRSPSANNDINFITIATTGNAQDFGDLTVARGGSNGNIASPTRAVFCGGDDNDVIDYVEIASTGNAVDFGNLVAPRTLSATCSNGHGGL
jgi:hypothetical protein